MNPHIDTFDRYVRPEQGNPSFMSSSYIAPGGPKWYASSPSLNNGVIGKIKSNHYKDKPRFMPYMPKHLKSKSYLRGTSQYDRSKEVKHVNKYESFNNNNNSNHAFESGFKSVYIPPQIDFLHSYRMENEIVRLRRELNVSEHRNRLLLEQNTKLQQQVKNARMEVDVLKVDFKHNDDVYRAREFILKWRIRELNMNIARNGMWYSREEDYDENGMGTDDDVPVKVEEEDEEVTVKVEVEDDA
ncbi:hypothetical protein V865_008520 [Kwoniella europaea PYCC6329]|uniref:Uncharacterized protein n=1 Tax=Kwoniella europaea PYCC6329 TaxID=1423913 RepID=A0AAX4KVD2_9TREE